MTTFYNNLSKLVLEIGANVLRKILEYQYKNDGISNFGTFLDMNKHKLFHGWKPDVTCCDSECMHLARRSRALISNQQWTLLYRQIRHDHVTIYPFCPCQYIKSNVTLSDLDIMTSSQLLRITSSNLSSSVINAITEITKLRNDLSRVKSTKIEMTRYLQYWRSADQAIVMLAGIISTNYQQEVKEQIRRLYLPGNILEEISNLSTSFSESMENFSTVSSPPPPPSTISSPPPSSTELMLIDEKLQEIQDDILDIKADVISIKQSYRVPQKYAGSEKELPGTDFVENPELALVDLEARLNAAFGGWFLKLKTQYTELSEKMDRLVDNEKLKLIDEDIDKISNKLEILENQNIDVIKKLDDITNLPKSRLVVPETLTRSQPVSVHNARFIKQTATEHLDHAQKKLLARDSVLTQVKVNDDLSIENKSDNTSFTWTERTKRVYLPRDNIRENKQKDESNFLVRQSNRELVKEAANDTVQNRDDHVMTNFEAGKVNIPDGCFNTNQRSFRDSVYQTLGNEQKQKSVVNTDPSDRLSDGVDYHEDILHSKTEYKDTSLDKMSTVQENSEVHTSGINLSDSWMQRSGAPRIIRKEYNIQKTHTIDDITEDSRILGPAKADMIQNRSSIQSQINTEVDGKQETVSDIIDKALDKAIQSGEIHIERENDDIQKLSSIGSTDRNSSIHEEQEVEETEEQKIFNYLDFAGLPHSREFKVIVEQAIKAHSKGHCRSVGMDTVICLDASGSLKGKLGDQMKSSALYLINYIENIAINRGLEENIGIVMFGKENKLLQVLTNDYIKVRQAIEQVTVDGTSPMLTGLLLSYIAIEIAGGATSILGHIVNPRIILLTDGRPTDDSLMSDVSIEYKEKSAEVRQKNIAFAEKLFNKGYSIYCVAIGQSSNKDFLHELSVVSDGSTFDMDKSEELGKCFQYHNIVGKVVSRLPDQFDSLECDNILTDEMKKNTPDFNQEDTSNIKAILKTNGIPICEEYDTLPHLGTRVCERSASGGGILLGTIIKHINKKEVTILWDDEREENTIFCGGVKHLEVVNVPHKLKKDELIREGVRAIRGAAWKYGDADGGIGSFGLVYRVTNEGIVKVRWDNGKRGKYHFDGVHEERNEVQIHKSSLWKKDPFDKQTHSIGMLVSPAVLGTGFRVGDKYVMTAYHLVKDIKAHLQIRFLISTEEGKTVNTFESFNLKTAVAYFDEDLDIALLELEECSKPYPPALGIYTSLLTSSQAENVHVLGFGADGYMTVLKCKIHPSKKAGTHEIKAVIPERNFTDEKKEEQLDKYRPINDPNKIILKCSHWQNGMDGAVGLAEIENDVFVVFMYLKAYPLFVWQSVEHQLGIDRPSVLEQGILTKTITDLVKASHPEVNKRILTKEFKMVWQIQQEEWEDFPADISDKLDTSFIHRGDKTCIITLNGYSIRVMFQTMQARYTATGYTVAVRRILRHLH